MTSVEKKELPLAPDGGPLMFRIEQIAVVVRDASRAKGLLRLIAPQVNATGERLPLVFAEDVVTAAGTVHGRSSVNVADLSFAYTLGEGLEFEVLDYLVGDNWMEGLFGVSHLGMHVTEDELEAWRVLFAQRKISVAQEVHTLSHTNPTIRDSRRYQYVIFDTRAHLGVDLKFIVRKPVPTGNGTQVDAS